MAWQDCLFLKNESHKWDHDARQIVHQDLKD